jgi:predicted transposase YbfD/YdcC
MRTKQDITFMSHFSKLPEPRISGMVTYPLNEILLVSLCAVLSGCDDFVEISEYGKEKLEFLRKFLPFSNGIPSHDTYANVFRMLDFTAFSECFISWVKSLSESLEGIIAIDGKTLRGSQDRKHGKAAIHMVSAFAHAQGLVLGQQKVSDKSNEITAIPELLDKLVIEGAIITIDAMGCQKEIAKKIVSKKADYLLAVKGNQPTLFSQIEKFFSYHRLSEFKKRRHDFHEETFGDHGRIEIRKHWTSSEISWLTSDKDWCKLSSIGMIEETRIIGDKSSTELRYYISSINNLKARDLAHQARSHWSVENNLHWVMDVSFKDDASRNRKDNSAENFHLIKQIAFNIIKLNPIKKSIKVKRKNASWNNTFLLQLLSTAKFINSPR